MIRRTFIAIALTPLTWLPGSAAPQTDPLPSWNDGTAKQSVVEFVSRVISPGGKDFAPQPERIVVFDNDGTQWAEQSVYFQLAFALDRVKALAPQHPEPRPRAGRAWT